MNGLGQTVDDHLKAIDASCLHLLKALHYSPEAVLHEIQIMESACRAFNEAYHGLQGKLEAAAKMMTLVAALHGQFAKQGLMDYEEFATFRENVFAIRYCASTLRDALGQSSVL